MSTSEAAARAALRAMDPRTAPTTIPDEAAARTVALGEDWVQGQRARRLDYLRNRAIAKGLATEEVAARLDAPALSRLLGEPA